MSESEVETHWVDNLPNDELGLRSMLTEVRRQIMILERQFLIEEDSDAEEDAKILAASLE